jgi:hypothetical protein
MPTSVNSARRLLPGTGLRAAFLAADLMALWSTSRCCWVIVPSPGDAERPQPRGDHLKPDRVTDLGHEHEVSLEQLAPPCIGLDRGAKAGKVLKPLTLRALTAASAAVGRRRGP